jgi:hypothetical protein
MKGKHDFAAGGNSAAYNKALSHTEPDLRSNGLRAHDGELIRCMLARRIVVRFR